MYYCSIGKKKKKLPDSFILLYTGGIAAEHSSQREHHHSLRIFIYDGKKHWKRVFVLSCVGLWREKRGIFPIYLVLLV
jgi:hypothetical protein